MRVWLNSETQQCCDGKTCLDLLNACKKQLDTSFATASVIIWAFADNADTHTRLESQDLNGVYIESFVHAPSAIQLGLLNRVLPKNQTKDAGQIMLLILKEVLPGLSNDYLFHPVIKRMKPLQIGSRSINKRGRHYSRTSSRLMNRTYKQMVCVLNNAMFNYQASWGSLHIGNFSTQPRDNVRLGIHNDLHMSSPCTSVCIFEYLTQYYSGSCIYSDWHTGNMAVNLQQSTYKSWNLQLLESKLFHKSRPSRYSPADKNSAGYAALQHELNHLVVLL